MFNINHHNFEYDFNGDLNLPANTGDRQWSQDKIRDFWALMEASGMSALGLTGDFNKKIIWGLAVSKGTGDTINVNSGVAITKYSVEVPNSYASTPPTKQSKDLNALVGLLSNLTNQPVTGGQINDNLYANATLDGVTTNYVKIIYKEIDGSSRQRAEATGTYPYEKSSEYEIRVEPVAPTAYEVELTRFTGSAGGSFTFNTTALSGYRILQDRVSIGDLIVDTNLIKTNPVNNRIGVNKTTPAKTLDVVGNGEFTEDLTVGTDLSAGGSISSATTRLATDLDLELGNETVRADLTTTNRPDASQYNVICAKFGVSNNTQLAMEIDSVNISPRMWFRKRTTSTWEAWYPIVTDTFNGTLTIDTGTSQGVLLPEDGGLEYLANAVESGGSYTRKYANSAFRIKPSVLADHKTYIDTAVDGTAGSAITWDNILTFDHVLKTISGAVSTPTLTVVEGTHVNATSVTIVLLTAVKVNNVYTVSFGISANTSGSGTVTIIFNFSGLTIANISGAANGYWADNTDQSFRVYFATPYVKVETLSANSTGVVSISGTLQFTV